MHTSHRVEAAVASFMLLTSITGAGVAPSTANRGVDTPRAAITLGPTGVATETKLDQLTDLLPRKKKL